MKVFIFITIGLLLPGIGLFFHYSTAYQLPTASKDQVLQSEYNGSQKHLKRLVQHAKEEGRSEVVLSALIDMKTGVTSMAQILSEYSILRIKVKDSYVSVTDGDIKTWYKLEVLEEIHRQNEVDKRPLPENIPAQLLPLLDSEVLHVQPGGVTTVEGIRVIQPAPVNQYTLKRGYDYLITSYLECGGKLLFPAAGVDGVFTVSDSTLAPLAKGDRELVREVEGVYGNHLDRLRSDTRMRPGREK
jgi:hypothetical protein